MSWQAYVDDMLVGSGSIDKAAISSQAGDSLWATSEGYKPSPDELKKIIAAFSDPQDAFSNGFYVCGERFVVIAADDSKLYGKKGREGVVISKTKQAILIGHYPETVQPGNATNVVEQLKDYLVKVNY